METTATEKTVTVLNDDGLHARPAGVFVKKASEFKSTIEVRLGGTAKNGKSIMSVMSLGVEKGSQLTISAKGEDAAQAVEALVELVNRKFGQAPC